MRVLVAGRNAKVLAQVAGAFASDLTMATATTKAAALALLDHTEFDLVVACETLGDGSGLEVLSQVAVNTPNTLRIFAARPATLTLLKSELGWFGLFRTLPYPINFRTLWAAIDLARGCLGNSDSDAAVGQPLGGQPAAQPGAPKAQSILASTPSTKQRQMSIRVHGERPAQTQSPQQGPRVRHVVLEGDLDATQPLPIIPDDELGGARNSARTPPRRSEGSVATTGQQRSGRAPGAISPQEATDHGQQATTPAHRVAAPAQQATTPAHQAATPAQRAAAAAQAATPAQSRIPESDAFKRARARRHDAKLRQEPSVTTESLAQLAQLSLKRRPAYGGRPRPTGRKRTALFVGSGVFAACIAGVLTFFMLGSNSSIGNPSLPMAASMVSMDEPIPQKVLPWQPAQPPDDATEPTPSPSIPDQTVTPAAADMAVEGEAASEQYGAEPDAPPPPPPNPPPGPSEPPQYDASGPPTQE